MSFFYIKYSHHINFFNIQLKKFGEKIESFIKISWIDLTFKIFAFITKKHVAFDKINVYPVFIQKYNI